MYSKVALKIYSAIKREKINQGKNFGKIILI